MANYMHGYAPIQFLGVLLKLFPRFFRPQIYAVFLFLNDFFLWRLRHQTNNDEKYEPQMAA